MPANSWIMFVQNYCKKTGCKYNEALRNPSVKQEYNKTKGK